MASTYLYLDCFLQQTITAIGTSMASIMITKRKATTPTATAITVASDGWLVGGSVDECVDGSIGGSVGGATLQPSGSKESITTGHAVSTCSCVEATVMGGVEVTQEARREDRSTAPGSVV